MDNLNLVFKAGEHVSVGNKNGKTFLCIEINESNVYTAQSGNKYVTLQAIVSNNSQYGDSHFMKVPGVYNKDTKTTTGIDAIIGNVKPIKRREQPQEQHQVPPLDKVEEDSNDSLPF